MRFADIPQFTQDATYQVNCSWSTMLTRTGADGDLREGWLDDYVKQGLQLEPDFQRSHVWTEEQQRRYVEYRLRGGKYTGRHLYFNHPYWQAVTGRTTYKDFVLVDGLQRITAVKRFMRNELAVFGGHYLREFEDSLRATSADFIVCINSLPSRAAVLQWYIDLNAGGVVHADEEINRVRELLAKEPRN